MNYDRIILELMNRVQNLEEQVATHSAWISSRDDEETDGTEENREGSYTRKQARDHVIRLIQNKYPNYLITTATRKEGSGIKIQKSMSNKPIFIKFYHSRSFIDKSGAFEHGWHVTRLTDVVGTNIDYCLYSLVDSSDNWNIFIFESEEIGKYHEEHRSDHGNVLHMYLSVQNSQGKELREETVDVTTHLNNWNVLQ